MMITPQQSEWYSPNDIVLDMDNDDIHKLIIIAEKWDKMTGFIELVNSLITK